MAREKKTSRKLYTKQEDALLLESDLTAAQLAKQLGRSRNGINLRRAKLRKYVAPVVADELLPCPFCPDGGDPHVERAGTTGIFWGGCRKCHTQGPPRVIREQAIVAWNTRQKDVPGARGGSHE